MRRILLSIVVAALCFVSATSHAGQVSQSMNVSLTIGAPGGQASLIVSPLVLVGPSPGPATGTAVVHVTATTNLTYSISLDGGLRYDPALAGAARALGSSTGVSLAYYLYQDPGYQAPWGNGDPNLGPGVGGVGTGSDQPYTVYGRSQSWAGSTIPNDTYTDVVTVAVNF